MSDAGSDWAGMNKEPFIEWMEDRRLDHQLVAEAPMRCYNLLSLQFMSIVIIVFINSYTIVFQHIVAFPCLSGRMSQRECKMSSVQCSLMTCDL